MGVTDDRAATTRQLLDGLLAQCVRFGASDLHLSAGNPPYLRIDGLLKPVAEASALSAETLERLADSLVSDSQRARFDEKGALDGAITAADQVRFRFNVFRSQDQYSIALRRLEDDFRSLEELGLSPSLYALCDFVDGLVIVAGPTGSGKSTTLATLLHRINRHRHGHIVTIEDPVEYLHRPIKCLINQREVGRDASDFNEALVAAMRQDPDIILVGEIRDLNTIRTAITAAETGHLVLTTVHAGDCVGSIERLVSVFPSDEQPGVRRQLSLILRAIISQHLLVADGVAKSIAIGEARPTRRRSRVVASEILMLTSAVANLIAFGKSAQIYSAMETGSQHGMQTLEQDLARLWVGGDISEKSALAIARNPNILRDRAAALRNPRRSGRYR